MRNNLPQIDKGKLNIPLYSERMGLKKKKKVLLASKNRHECVLCICKTKTKPWHQEKHNRIKKKKKVRFFIFKKAIL